MNWFILTLLNYVPVSNTSFVHRRVHKRNAIKQVALWDYYIRVKYFSWASFGKRLQHTLGSVCEGFGSTTLSTLLPHTVSEQTTRAHTNTPIYRHKKVNNIIEMKLKSSTFHWLSRVPIPLRHYTSVSLVFLDVINHHIQ